MADLLSILEAQQKILSVIAKRDPETCFAEEAYGRVLAENIHSPINLPPFTNSAMDGFAVRSVDTQKASPSSPVRLPVKMDIPAGYSDINPMEAGTAARILTGAPIPPGADAVVMVENTDLHGSSQTVALARIGGDLFAGQSGRKHPASRGRRQIRPAGPQGRQNPAAAGYRIAHFAGYSTGLRETDPAHRPVFLR